MLFYRVLTYRYHPRVLAQQEHMMSEILERGHREISQQGETLLQT